MKTVKFITLGCKVNQYDTQFIRENFINTGFQELEDSKPADIYVINTCTVTDKADKESLYYIRRAYCQNPQAKIIVTGCLTELDNDRILQEPGVGLIVKNKDKNRIPELLNECNGLNPVRSPHQRYGSRLWRLTSNGVNGQTSITNNSISKFEGHTRAFLKIQDGCNNFCSYCKVPLVRGLSRSKPLNEIIKEANRLAKNGFKEIVLCGICLGAYGKDLPEQPNLIDVIQQLENIEDLLRIRLSSIEAADISDGLIDWMADSKKLCRHLHIPMQSGDDEILKKMNRKFSRQEYANLIKKIRAYIPEIAITTDVLVGFPGEEDENFQNTVRLIKEILPLRTHIFSYSKREGTLAAENFKENLDHKIIKKRVNYLKNVAQACSFNYRKRFLNKNAYVLVEANLKENKGWWQGHTDNYIKVQIKSSKNLKNQLVQVRLKKINEGTIYGTIVNVNCMPELTPHHFQYKRKSNTKVVGG